MYRRFGTKNREVNKLKMAAEAEGLFWKSCIPFSDDIMSDKAPPSLRLLNIEYDGTTDPWDHLCQFEKLILMYRYSDGVKCRLFLTTLSKSALRWFNQLPAKSIRKFDELSLAFMKQYIFGHMKPENTQFVKKMKGETLSSYVDRFMAGMANMPPSFDEDDFARLLVEGLRDHDGKLYRSLRGSNVRTFYEDELMKWADRIQREIERAFFTKNWRLGRLGMMLAVFTFFLAVVLHWFGFIGK